MVKQWMYITLACLLYELAHAYRECYHCDTRAPFDSADACSARGPVTRRLNRFKFMDDDEECYKCVKEITPSGHVYRGCISKQQHRAIEEFFSKDDACSDRVIMPGTRAPFKEYCKCSENKCNGGRGLVASPFILLFTCLAVLLTCASRLSVIG